VLRLWEFLNGLLAGNKYWPRVQPYAGLVSLWLMAHALMLEFLASEYHVSLPVSLYVRSFCSSRSQSSCWGWQPSFSS
jgi:hypothetical protein